MIRKPNSSVRRALLATALIVGGGLSPAGALDTAQNEGRESDGKETAVTPSEAEKLVLKRAQKRWDRLLEGEIDAAYEYTSPAYRTRTSLQRFRAQFGNALRWDDATVTSAQCEEARCRVSVDVTYTLPQEGITQTRAISETWILSEQKWWVRMGR